MRYSMCCQEITNSTCLKKSQPSYKQANKIIYPSLEFFFLRKVACLTCFSQQVKTWYVEYVLLDFENSLNTFVLFEFQYALHLSEKNFCYYYIMPTISDIPFQTNYNVHWRATEVWDILTLEVFPWLSKVWLLATDRIISGSIQGRTWDDCNHPCLHDRRWLEPYGYPQRKRPI